MANASTMPRAIPARRGANRTRATALPVRVVWAKASASVGVGGSVAVPMTGRSAMVRSRLQTARSRRLMVSLHQLGPLQVRREFRGIGSSGEKVVRKDGPSGVAIESRAATAVVSTRVTGAATTVVMVATATSTAPCSR